MVSEQARDEITLWNWAVACRAAGYRCRGCDRRILDCPEFTVTQDEAGGRRIFCSDCAPPEGGPGGPGSTPAPR